ncbi:MAG: SH3 domain-containing protein [Chloroflexi bacterium]|nr:SH3 domain-containing protein [Chloroflexota bacterium]
MAVVASQGINVRTGPGVEFDIIGTALRGSELAVVGRNEDQSWWRICCVEGQPGWVSSDVVTIRGQPDAVPLSPPLLPDDLEATWAIRWECHAEGCAQEECLGESQAQALRVRTARWLEVKREVTWQNECGEEEDWLTQVDRYTGQEERIPSDPPLFYIWEGTDPGAENRSIEMLGRTLSLWCTDTRTRETEQGDGWIVLYEGQACYDRAAGVLITLQYTKRWLFTGTFEGQTYDRAYFGDYEVYLQILAGTNAPLSGGE